MTTAVAVVVAEAAGGGLHEHHSVKSQTGHLSVKGQVLLPGRCVVVAWVTGGQ